MNCYLLVEIPNFVDKYIIIFLLSKHINNNLNLGPNLLI